MSNIEKPRFLIYSRKEFFTLLFLAIIIAAFSFTLGVHLGKKVGSQSAPMEPPEDAPLLESASDQTPSRLELDEDAKSMNEDVDDTLSNALKEEVGKSGIQLKNKIDTTLPTQVKESNPKADLIEPEEVKHTSKPEPQTENHDSSKEVKKKELGVKPHGVYTLQVGSFPHFEEAHRVLKKLSKRSELEFFIRPAQLKGRGEWYRVMTGGFEKNAIALKMGSDFVKRGWIKSFVVLPMPQE